MKNIQQLIKQNEDLGYSKIYPKSYIDAITDKESGMALEDILNSFNMYFLSYNGNTSATRCSVPMVLRKKGLWITYVKYDGNVYTEWYAANKIDDKSWGDSSNWRIGNNTLVGDITISANGNWVINGAETEFKAVGEKGNTPLIRVANNRLQVSYDLGDTYRNVTENPVYTQFRNYNNKIQVSTDLGATWVDASDEIAAYFRWQSTSEDALANNVGRLQISRDNKTWTNLSNDIINNLHISKYIGANEPLPTSGIAEGTIYAKGPTYAVEDTSNSNPIYRLWVYAWKNNILAWQDNGEFTSIAAGIVQETGNNEDVVMSQKATTEVIHEILYDVSANNDGAVFESLSALLSSSNLSTFIPTSVRRGGMSIRFIQGAVSSSDNKYVQYRLMADKWSTIVNDWQMADDGSISNYLKNELSDLTASLTIIHAFRTPDGRVIEQSNWNMTEPILCKQGDLITVSGYATVSVASICEVDSNNTLVEALVIGDNSTKDRYVHVMKECYISCCASNNSAFRVKKITSECINKIISEIDIPRTHLSVKKDGSKITVYDKSGNNIIFTTHRNNYMYYLYNPVLNFKQINVLGLTINNDDDVAPVHAINTTIGANHGQLASMVTVANHGLSNADVGTEWIDGNNKKQYIIRIHNADTIVFLSENQGTYKTPSFVLVSGSLTKGGTTLVPTNITSTQIWPAVKNVVHKYFGDNIENEGSFDCVNACFSEEYDVMHPENILTKLNGRVGTTKDPNWEDANSFLRVKNSYYITKDLDVIVSGSYNARLSEYTFKNIMFSQASPIASDARYYIPGAISDINGINFTQPVHVNWGNISTISLNSEKSVISNSLLKRIIQFKDNVMFAFGYVPVSIGNNLENYTSTSFEINGRTGKIYPHGVDSTKVSMLTQDKEYTGIIYRVFRNTTSLPAGILCKYAFEFNNYYYMFVDFSASGIYDVSFDNNNIIGKSIEIVEAHNCNIISDTYVNSVTIDATYVSGNTTFAVLKCCLGTFEDTDRKTKVLADAIEKVEETCDELSEYINIEAVKNQLSENGYYNVDGNFRESEIYKHTSVIPIHCGDKVIVTCYSSSSMSVISEVDGNGTFIQSLQAGDPALQTYTFISTREMYIVVSGAYSGFNCVVESSILKDALRTEPSQVIPLSDKYIDGGYWNNNGKISTSPSYSFTAPIEVNPQKTIISTSISSNARVLCFKNGELAQILLPSDFTNNIKEIIGFDHIAISTNHKTATSVKTVPFNSSFNGSLHIDNNSMYPSIGTYNGINSVFVAKVPNVDKAYISFKFKLNEDINVGDTAVVTKLMRLYKSGNYFDTVVKKQIATTYSIYENSSAKNIISTYPMCKYRATFGWNSNVDRNVYLGERNLNQYKPICGKPLISIRFAGITKNTKLDRDDEGVQEDLIANIGYTVEINNTHIIIRNGDKYDRYNLSVNTSLRDLYNKLLNNSNNPNSVCYNLEFEEYGIDGYTSYDLQQCPEIPLVTQYPSNNGRNPVAVYDAFPFFIRAKIDDSWHQFEMVIDNGNGYFQIDGQNKSVTSINISDLLPNSTLFIGGFLASEIQHTIKDIDVYFGSTGDAEYNFENTTNFSKIISSKSPAVLGLMMHSVFEGAEVDGISPSFIVNGGTIPNKYKPGYGENPKNWIGAIWHPEIATSTGRLNRVLKYLYDKGYTPVSYKDIQLWKQGFKELPKRCFFTLHDDRETYIYANQYMKSIYEKYGYHGTFCIELDSYLNNEIATDADRKLIPQMNLNGWEVILHGEVGTEFTGKSYRKTLTSILSSISKGNSLFTESSFWSNSTNASTPNSIMLFEANGIALGIATDGWYTTKGTSDFYIRRNDCCDRTAFSVLISNIY